MCTVVLSSFLLACSCVSSAVAMYSSELRPKLHIPIYYYCSDLEMWGFGN